MKFLKGEKITAFHSDVEEHLYEERCMLIWLFALFIASARLFFSPSLVYFFLYNHQHTVLGKPFISTHDNHYDMMNGKIKGK